MRHSNPFILSFVLILAVTILLPPTASAQIRTFEEDDSSKIHRLHVLMNHGLIMFLDGINLRMISSMRMSPQVDYRTETFALHNIRKGEKAIETALTGDQMQILVEQGFGDHPLMRTAVELGETMLKLVEVLQEMDMEVTNQNLMDLHHMHLLTNKGLMNIAQGSNMIMATLLASIPQIDMYLANHGRNMAKEGRALIVEISGSSKYKELLKSSGNEQFVAQRKQCTDLSLKIADILARMQMWKER